MARSMRGYGTAGGIAVAIGGLIVAAGGGTGAAQTNNAPRPLHGIEQSTGGPTPGEQSDFLRVPEVAIVPGAVNVRPDIKNPMASDPTSAERGMQYFVKFNCVGCHAPNAGGGMGPALSDGHFKYGADPANIYLTIAHGRPMGMPSWGALLPDQVVWDLVSYIESISKAPQPAWGQTVSLRADMPAVEQVPAEFKQTTTPWQFTQRFGNGQSPNQSSSGSGGLPPMSGSSQK